MILESLAQASFSMLRQANRRHDVVAVQITDPYELELPELGRLVLEDAETGEIVEVGTGDARKRKAFAERQSRAQSDLTRLFRTAGIDAIRLRTDQPYTSAWRDSLRHERNAVCEDERGKAEGGRLK